MECIYFLYFRDKNLIKIGLSKNLLNRVLKLRDDWGYLDISKCYVAIPSAPQTLPIVESTVHGLLWKYRTKGESTFDGYTEMFSIDCYDKLNEIFDILKQQNLIEKILPFNELSKEIVSIIDVANTKPSTKANFVGHEWFKESHYLIERRLEVLRDLKPFTEINNSWINYMRKALGMSLKQLAKRAELAIATAAQAERREVENTVSITTLKKFAEAMEADLYYAIVPRKTISETREAQAKKKALAVLGITEEQISSLETDIKMKIEELQIELLSSRDLWD